MTWFYTIAVESALSSLQQMLLKKHCKSCPKVVLKNRNSYVILNEIEIVCGKAISERSFQNLKKITIQPPQAEPNSTQLRWKVR